MITKRKTLQAGETTFILDPKSKWLTIKVGDQKKKIERKALLGIAFLIANSHEQESLVTIMEKQMMQFDRIHKIQASKDIKQGEIIQFHCHVDVPTLVVEHLLKEAGVTDPASAMKPSEEFSTAQ